MRPRLALVAALLLGGCASRSTRAPAALDQGYLLGAADTVKQLYWAKQALESKGSGAPAGRVEYYRWEDPGQASDKRSLAPETVSVPVFIPAPVPARQVP